MKDDTDLWGVKPEEVQNCEHYEGKDGEQG